MDGRLSFWALPSSPTRCIRVRSGPIYPRLVVFHTAAENASITAATICCPSIRTQWSGCPPRTAGSLLADAPLKVDMKRAEASYIMPSPLSKVSGCRARPESTWYVVVAGVSIRCIHSTFVRVVATSPLAVLSTPCMRTTKFCMYCFQRARTNGAHDMTGAGSENYHANI